MLEGRKKYLTILFSPSAGQCFCQVVYVSGSSCPSINGNYNKPSNNTDALQNATDKQPPEKKRKRSQCLLTQLSRCLVNKRQDSYIKNGCQKYMKPLMSNSSNTESDHENYIMENYRIIKGDEHDFWSIGEFIATLYVELIRISFDICNLVYPIF